MVLLEIYKIKDNKISGYNRDFFANQSTNQQVLSI